MAQDTDEQGVQPPPTDWDEQGEGEDEDEEEDDDMYGPATLTFIGQRAKAVDSGEGTKKKAGAEEEENALERLKDGDDDVGMEDVGFGCGSMTLAFRSR
jgi:hypothetical protein